VGGCALGAREFRRDKRTALVNTLMELRVPWNTGNIFNSWSTRSFSRRGLLRGVMELFDWKMKPARG